MKKLGLIFASLFFTIVMVSTAQAIYLAPNAYNGLGFEASEEFINDPDVDNPFGVAGNVLTVGDQFWGVMSMTDIDGNTNASGNAGTTIWSEGGPPDWPEPSEITAYFAIEIYDFNDLDFTGGTDINGNDPGDVGYIPTPDGNDDVRLFEYGPLTLDFTGGTDINGNDPGDLGYIDTPDGNADDPNGIIDPSQNEVLRVFEDFQDPIGDYDPTTTQTGLDTATNGTHIWSLGFDPTIPDGYFLSDTPPGLVELVEGAVTLAYSGLNILPSLSPQDPDFVPICDPNEPYVNGPLCIGNIPSDNLTANLLVELFFNNEANVENTPDGFGTPGNQAFDIDLNDPAVVRTTSAIPEPTSMLLLGTGLVGLAGASRRRKKAAKK